MKTLLTGFNRFGDLALNPSQSVVEALAGRNPEGLVAEVLPTEYAGAAARIRSLIRKHRPGRVICLGVNMRIAGINLERVAVNVDDAVLPDNAGSLRSGSPIIRGGPAAYLSTLHLRRILASLGKCGIPAAISNHAGTFVCNHVFYAARHEVERMGSRARCGFVHVPPLLETGGPENGDPRGLTLAQMLEAAECLLETA
jgi:pyroglutamyl-peptidase